MKLTTRFLDKLVPLNVLKMLKEEPVQVNTYKTYMALWKR